MKTRRLLPLLLGVLASVAVGSMVATRLSWQAVSGLWLTARPSYLALGFCAYFAANVLRARRFRTLTGDQIATRTMLRTVIIQNILNTFLPLRAGEVSYLYMVHKTGVVKAGDNVGSLLGARVLDLLAALALPLAALPFSRASSADGHAFLWFGLVAATATLGFILGVWRAEPLSRWLSARASTQRAWLNRALMMASDVLTSLAQLRRGALLLRVVGLTLGCWGLVYLSGYLNLVGVGVSVPVSDAVFAYSFPNLASMTPFYMLGGFGVFEGTFGMGLHLVGVPLDVAMASGLVLHVAELLFVVSLAPVALLLRVGEVESAQGMS
jgi:uncharacterized membrane protein YbhN (UPF0104 family)